MMFYLDERDKKLCTGCAACVQACPVDCLKLVEDDERFLYPQKDVSICINCGKCEKVCHMTKIGHIKKNSFEQKAYCAVHKDPVVVAKSSSGGAFTGITKEFCKEDYVIFGAEFNSELKVVHSYRNSIEKAFVYRKSKYVQSEIGQSYQQAKGFLQDGKKVLFTGTPCQIAGLKAYLGEEYENLLCVDLVCHGVPNQFLFNMYLKELAIKYGSKVNFLEFRYRIKKGKEYDTRNLCATLASGKSVIKSRKKSSYLLGFHSALYYRPSCYSCPYANPNRVSDITIADFWKVKVLYPDLDPHQGVSLIYVNTNRGREIISTLNQQMDIRPVELEFAIRYGGQFREPTKYNKYREKFFKLIKKGVPLKSAVKQCTPKVSIIKVIVSKLLGQKRKEKLKQFLGR